jgi:hypothetical protein
MTPIGKMSQENVELTKKIILGFNIAYERLVRKQALLGKSLVVSRNGKPTHVPATELLIELESKQRG